MTSNLVEYVEANWPHESLDALVRVVQAEIEDLATFTKRGITPLVRETRPYIRWTTDEPEAAKEPFAGTSAANRAHITKIVNQSGGRVITRHAPPMRPPLPPIYPELRPDHPVKTQGPRLHYHGTKALTAGELAEWARSHGRLPKWLERIDSGKERFDPNGPPPSWLDTLDPAGTGRAHIARSKQDDDHHGVNSESPHFHQPFAKYVFPLEDKMDRAYVHDHDEYQRPAARQRHLDRHHEGAEPGTPHAHNRGKVRDPGKPRLAARIDVHPLAVERVLADPVVFFGIEGCLKADAILSAGGAVFSVPSVSLWDAEELERFVLAYLIGPGEQPKTVVIVPDADWSTKWQVESQARMCQAALHRLGITDVHVAAPPLSNNGVGTKGVDDFLGPASGGRLEDLLVIDNETPPGVEVFVRERLDARGIRSDRAYRNTRALRALVTYTARNGEVAGALRTVGRLVGMQAETTWRALRDLRDLGALETQGDILDVEPKTNPLAWPSRELVWTPPPGPGADWEHPRAVLTLVPELRPVPLPERRLGDILTPDMKETLIWTI